MAAFAARAKQKIFGVSSDVSIDDNYSQDNSENTEEDIASPLNRAGSIKALFRNPFSRGSTAQSVSVDSASSVTSSDQLPAGLAEDAVSRSPKESGDNKSPLSGGVFDYTVKDGDTLRSIAACFDTTPSILKRVNKLTMDVLFPGQVIKIPDKSYVFNPISYRSEIKRSKSGDVKSSKTPSVVPGHVMRKEASCHSFTDESELPPRALSLDEAEYLDQECFERFIKINSHYITEHMGSVDGTLLVTPNAVMFDPNLSNELVKEKGADEFGMIAKMDTIMSVAIYHDLEAMGKLQKRRSDSSVAKPTVYRSISENPPTDNLKLETSEHRLSAPQLLVNTEQSTSQSSESASEAEQSETTEAEEKVTFSIDSSVLLSPAALVKTTLHLDSNKVTSSSISSQSPTDINLTGQSGELNVVDSSSSVEVIEYDFVNSTAKVGNSSFFSLVEEFDPLNSKAPSTKKMNDKTVKKKSSSSASSSKSSLQKGSRSSSPSPPVSIKIESAVTLDEKPDLFCSLSEMLPQGLAIDAKPHHTQQPSLYLCLKVGQPINKKVSKNCPIESYSKKKRPEYWFSVPREKVDHLYAFFIQWKSEAYDKEESECQGFVVINNNNAKEADNTKENDSAPNQLKNSIAKDWEIVSLDEVRRRKTLLDIEKYTPLPELIGESVIFEESQLRQLMQAMPSRVEGYPWTLVFSTEKDGFTLSKLYRNSQDIDSPVLLILETTEKQIFGALSSCSFHTSDNFYGTGESFLFSFVDGFKTYPWSGINEFFNKGDANCLSIGAGEGSYGLWIDGDIYLGRTQNCQTYANDPLTGGNEDFHIKALEVWSFHDDY